MAGGGGWPSKSRGGFLNALRLDASANMVKMVPIISWPPEQRGGWGE